MKTAKAICILILCLLAAGCAQSSPAYTPQAINATYHTNEETQPASQISIEKLEALGVTIATHYPMVAGIPPVAPGFVLIPGVPFGIVDYDAMEVLLTVVEELYVAGEPALTFDGIRSSLNLAGLWDAFHEKQSAMRIASMGDSEYAFFRMREEINQRHGRVAEILADRWPDFIINDYINPLEELGFSVVLPSSLYGRFRITWPEDAPFGITDEDGLRVLLTALEHLVKSNNLQINHSDMISLAYSLSEAGLWHTFAEMAQERYKSEWIEVMPLVQQLEDLGILVSLVFHDPAYRHYCFNSLGIPQYLYVTHQEFGITYEAHLLLLAEALAFRPPFPFSPQLYVAGLSGIRAELEAAGLITRFDEIYSEVLMLGLYQESQLREQAFVR